MENQQKIDVLSIGDITTEPFIKLSEALVLPSPQGQQLCVNYGDKVAFESAEVLRAVGNAGNSAVSAARLGLNSYLLAYVGNDSVGKGDIDELEKNNVHTDFIVTVPDMPSNYHYVLWYGVERTILVNHHEYPYSFPKTIPEPKWIYFTSIASNSLPYTLEIAQYLKAHPNVKLAFQPGTFQMKLGTNVLKDIYACTELFFCNFEEAQRILNTTETDKKKLMNMIRGLGPKIAVVTDGINGAYADDGTNQYFMPVYPHEPFERTGAGDAFSSTLTSALALGKTLEEALTWAPINAMSVTLQVGAQKGLLSMEKLQEYLANAPEDYKLKKI